jgi:hypothetical protein
MLATSFVGLGWVLPLSPVGRASPLTKSRSAAPQLVSSVDAAFAEAASKNPQKASLMEGLRRECLRTHRKNPTQSQHDSAHCRRCVFLPPSPDDSFFQPMEVELYNEAVSFEDPLISLSGLVRASTH